ncbi:MAG TPA: ribosome maturation factor RimP [Streptosporangiaceae bacterium]|nr:ribosome maturation factor RimP [Streptosporangiaceae bacterium]
MPGGSRHAPRPGAAPANRPPRNAAAASPRGHDAGASADESRIADVIGPVIAAAGMDLESVRVTAAGRRRLLRVVVDSDRGVSLDDAAAISRELSAALDTVAVMGDFPYTLEVSSPGVDRPLTDRRHWRRAVGRLVRVTVADSGPVVGRVVAADADGVTLDLEGDPDNRRRFAYGVLGAGAIQVEFGHPQAELGAAGDGH